MISLCITTFNRTELLYESFRQIIDHPFIDEIVIVDDCSGADTFLSIVKHFKDVPKVIVYYNDFNLDCYRNKLESISKARNEWLIIADSDNVFSKEYIDRIENLWIAGLNPKTIYQPSYAKPHFSFEKFAGKVVDRKNVGLLAHDEMFTLMLNAMNYFVNRDEYLKVWDGSLDPVTSDSIFQNYNWFNAGNNMYVVPDLNYEHRVHNGSHYQNNVRRTERGFHESIVNKLKAMK